MILAQSPMEQAAEAVGTYLACHGAELEKIDATVDPFSPGFTFILHAKDGRSVVLGFAPEMVRDRFRRCWEIMAETLLAKPLPDTAPRDGFASDGWWRDVPEAVRQAVRAFARKLMGRPGASELECDRMIASLGSAELERLIERAAQVFGARTTQVGG